MSPSRQLKRLAWRVYRLLVSLLIRSRVTKIRLRGRPLGFWGSQILRRILRSVIPEPAEVHGMVFHHHVDRRTWLGLLYTTDYEPETRKLAQRIVKPGMTVVDVGAQIGYFTLLFAGLVGRDGSVYSFEPDPTIYPVLRKNIEANDLSDTVEVFNTAVADADGRASFYQVGVGGSLFEPEESVGTIETTVTSLDSVLAEHGWPPVDVVKVDTEGAEPLVLKGMRELCRRNSDVKLIIEFSVSNLRDAGTTADELLEQLVELGFADVTVLSPQGSKFELPHEAPMLIEAASAEGPVVNLLCERPAASERKASSLS